MHHRSQLLVLEAVNFPSRIPTLCQSSRTGHSEAEVCVITFIKHMNQSSISLQFEAFYTKIMPRIYV